MPKFCADGRTKEGGQSQKKEGGKASGWAPEIRPKHRKSLPNGRQQEPQGGGAKRRPLGAAPKAPPCCLPFGMEFLCFGLISGAHPDVFPPSFFLWLSTVLGLPILGGGPLLVSSGCQMTRPPHVGDRFLVCSNELATPWHIAARKPVASFGFCFRTSLGPEP